jgi:hypothetical protein
MARSVLSFLVLVCACGSPAPIDDDGRDPTADPGDFKDDDGDKFAEVQGDCDDTNADIHPGFNDWCDGVDNDCDGKADQDYDLDLDDWATCKGDCQDGNANIHPGVKEVLDGVDQDCDEKIDNHTEVFDDDEDGFSEMQGDCDDESKSVGPGALEVVIHPETGEPEKRDNDCDGMTDEAALPCVVEESMTPAQKLAAAADVCDWLEEAVVPETGVDERSRGVFANYGTTYVPKQGESFLVLSSGIAGDADDTGFVSPQSGTSFSLSSKHPDPQGAIGCSAADQTNVNDMSELSLRLQVPTNVNSLSFDFNFMSAEFPEFVCTSFDDTFLALLESQSFTGNISFDSMKNRVSINVGFFDQCDPVHGASCEGAGELTGTGYEVDGGGTGWLSTTAPVTPGGIITLRFVIFDEGDNILDSAVIIDNFRWGLAPIEDPITVE